MKAVPARVRGRPTAAKANIPKGCNPAAAIESLIRMLGGVPMSVFRPPRSEP